MRERQVIKRSGSKVDFDSARITAALSKAISASRDRDYAVMAPKLCADMEMELGGKYPEGVYSVEDIQRLCDYAHQFGVKIYATLNTLLRPEELEPARLIAWDLYHAGVDAFITQDEALLRLALPPVPLHASTQMDNRTKEDVARLKKLGFNQVVLARELSLEQIKEIHKAVPDVTLEAFVHGALCVSYSGRCYASEYCFNRSANRGECAQFCRLPFTLEDANGNALIKDKYLLSLKDMNRQKYLEQMMDAGVRSFKIEGRLKDIAYVKNVTAAYREALDDILKRRPEFARSSYGTSTYTFQPDLSRSFSRGYTDYFLFGRTNDLASPDTPKSRGREVGHVKEVRWKKEDGRGCVIVSSTETFNNGDGLCFLDEEGKLQGFRVNRAEGNHLYLNSNLINSNFKIRKGNRLWRSFDKGWEDMMSGKTTERRISAQFLLEETEQGFRLTFTAEDGTNRSEEFVQEHQLARTDQTTSIKEVLSKLGDTPYICQDVEIRFSQPWFIPRSILAEWRRKIIDHSPLTIDRLATPETTLNDNSQCPPVNSVMFNGPSATAIAPWRKSVQECSMVNNPLMLCRFCLRHAWGQCKKEKTSQPPLGGEIIRWQDPLYLVLGDGRRFRLEFDCKRCEMKLLVPDKA